MNWSKLEPAEKDAHESEEYQKFVESMVPHCRCEFDQPCDGVLAGGPCDQRRRHNDHLDGEEQNQNPD